MGSTRLRHTIEEHGAGSQLVRYRIWPRIAWPGLVLPLVLGLLATLALNDKAWTGAAILTVLALVAASRALWECGCAAGAIVRAVDVGPVEELEQALIELVRETQMPESEFVGVSP